MKKINEIISKAIVDKEFHNALLNDPTGAASGFGLSDEEMKELASVNFAQLDQLNVALEERLSKSIVKLPELDTLLDNTYFDKYSEYYDYDYNDW